MDSDNKKVVSKCINVNQSGPDNKSLPIDD